MTPTRSDISIALNDDGDRWELIAPKGYRFATELANTVYADSYRAAKRLAKSLIMEPDPPLSDESEDASMSDKANHTPGPYRIRRNKTQTYSGLPSSPTCAIENETGTRILAHIALAEPEDEANARLFAAAPDMATALRDFLTGSRDLQTLIDNARALLARIDGEAS